jgi:sensor domain CHASE-containing protein
MKHTATATVRDEFRLQFRVRVYSALAFLATLAICAACAFVGWRAILLYEQKAAEVIAANQGAVLQDHLNRSLSATYAVASVLRHGKGQIAHFDTLAQEMLKIYSGISSLQLAKGGVITEVVPLAGNEKALGHDLLQDPARNKEAFLAIDTHKLTLAGPFDLVQGGQAVIGRLPVFLPDDFGADQFWGFATALIRIPEFLATSNLPRLTESGYDYQLAFIHPDTRQARVFASSRQGALPNPVVQTIEVPNGKWFLSVAPRDGWVHPSLLAAAAAAALLIATFVASVTRTVLQQPILLRREVAARTEELAHTNRNLKREIIERERARQAAAQITRLYSVLSHTNSSIARIGSRHQLLQEICHATVEYGGFPLAKIGMLDERSGHMDWLAQSGQHVPLPQCDGARCQALAIDNAMPGLRMIVCSRVQHEHEPSAPTCREAQAAGFSSHVMLQIKVGARVAGVLSVYAYEANFFDSAQLRLLQEMSDDIGFALDQIERAARGEAEPARLSSAPH